MKKLFFALIALLTSCTSPYINAQTLPNTIIFHLKNQNSKLTFKHDNPYFYAGFEYARTLLKAGVGNVEKDGDILDVIIEISAQQLMKAIDKTDSILQAKQIHHLNSSIQELKKESQEDLEIQAVNTAIERYHIIKALGFKCKALKYILSIGFIATTSIIACKIVYDQRLEIDSLNKKIDIISNEPDICKKNYELLEKSYKRCIGEKIVYQLSNHQKKLEEKR